MLLNAIRKLKYEAAAGFTLVEGPVSGAYFDGDAEALSECEATVVEGSTLAARPVGGAAESGFGDFLDGIQRAEVKLYHETVPIIYAYAAAAIRRRSERQMRTLRTDGADWLIEREALFYPSRYVQLHQLAQTGAASGQLLDTTPAGSEPVPLFPPLLYARAGQHVNRWRESIERELAVRWCSTREAGWLLVDGSITISPELAACRGGDRTDQVAPHTFFRWRRRARRARPESWRTQQRVRAADAQPGTRALLLSAAAPARSA